MDKEEQELMSTLYELKRPVHELLQIPDEMLDETNTVTVCELNDNLNEINETKNKIIEIKKNLNIIIDTITANPSFVTRAANAWGELSTWKKVGTGLVLTLPPIFVGVAANVATLLTLGGVTSVVYTTSGLILEDHHNCSNETKQKIKDGIAGITGILEITINALNKIHQQLQIELDKFRLENFRLAEQVMTLHYEVDSFCDEVERLRILTISLAERKKQLEHYCNKLELSNEEQKELFAKTQEELLITENDYQKTREELKKGITELATVREAMLAEVVKAGKISESLQYVMSHFSEDVTDEQAEQDELEAKLKTILQQEEAMTARLVKSYNDTQVELKTATDDMKKSRADNHNLLHQQQQLIQKLELVSVRGIESMYSKGTRTSQAEGTFFDNRNAASAREVGQSLLLRI